MTPRALILTIGQNQRNLELLVELLDSEGYEAHRATSLETQLPAHDGVDLVILDLDGFGPDVWSACEQVTSQSRAAVLVLAGNRLCAVREEAAKRGVDAVIEKPLEKQELRARIDQVLG